MTHTPETLAALLADAAKGSEWRKRLHAAATTLATELSAALVREAELRGLVRAEIAARNVYEETPTDRGGSYGPKGRALAKWLDARADVLAALAAKPEERG